MALDHRIRRIKYSLPDGKKNAGLLARDCGLQISSSREHAEDFPEKDRIHLVIIDRVGQGSVVCFYDSEVGLTDYSGWEDTKEIAIRGVDPKICEMCQNRVVRNQSYFILLGPKIVQVGGQCAEGFGSPGGVALYAAMFKNFESELDRAGIKWKKGEISGDMKPLIKG